MSEGKSFHHSPSPLPRSLAGRKEASGWGCDHATLRRRAVAAWGSQTSSLCLQFAEQNPHCLRLTHSLMSILPSARHGLSHNAQEAAAVQVSGEGRGPKTALPARTSGRGRSSSHLTWRGRAVPSTSCWFVLLDICCLHLQRGKRCGGVLKGKQQMISSCS